MDSSSSVTIAFRIPGKWSGPKELVERLPEGHRLTPESLFLPDGTEIGFGGANADNQFAQIFRSSLRQEATEEELATVDSYKVNLFLSGPGGSKEAAHTMMKAAAALIRAGGAGVFIDNSGLAHGGQQWLRMTEDGSSDAISYAYVAIVAGKTEVWTMGMHALGLRDVLMKKADIEKHDFDIVEVIRYLAAGDKPIENGHVLADLEGPRFQAFTEDSPKDYARSPMHNPYGRLRLVSMKDIAEKN
ncbi:MAG TPA: hypothetical protein VKS79_14455 [Gemmataceae bacterium]|nr:hypothetical protein [Gemmataceae bacterium]